MSLLLIFSASYQLQVGSSSSSHLAICSLLSDLQYNCTAEFAIDINPSVGTIESVNVTVCGSYGNVSSRNTLNTGTYNYVATYRITRIFGGHFNLAVWKIV